MKHYGLYFSTALIVLVANISAAYGYTLQPQQAGDITYVTGGIGDEEREAIEAAKKDYNLAITSASASGAYVGDTHVVISNRRGQELLNAYAGPLFYAQLPAGKYIVESESNGQVRTQNVTIANGKPATIQLSWK